METPEQINKNKFTQFDINLLLENTLNKTWDVFVCDDILLNEIEKYIHSDGTLKSALKSQILTRFLKRSNDDVDTSNDNRISEFNKFIELLWEDRTKIMDELSESLSLNLFRSNENLKKLNYIKENSDITDDIILIAKNLSVNNWYHNFWHEIWVAETTIKLCKECGIDRNMINLLVLAALFHDSGYTKTYDIDLEKLACNLSNTYLPNKVFDKMAIKREDFNNLIMMTNINNRKTDNEEHLKILQDADFWCLWQWPYYILYACMWLIDEWVISLDNFVDDELKFVKNHLINGSLYLSNSWNKVLESPIKSLEIIASWPRNVIEKAYNLRKSNITFEEFKNEIDSMLKQ